MKNNKTEKVIRFTVGQILESRWFYVLNIICIGVIGLVYNYEKIIKVLFGEEMILTVEDSFAVLRMLYMMILYFTILIYGTNIANSVVEEKSGRIIETLLCYVKPSELLLGKIVGYLIAVLIQSGILSVAIAIMRFLHRVDRSTLVLAAKNVDVKYYILAVGSLIIGFLTYSIIYAALASFAENSQDSTQLLVPITIIIMVVYLAGIVLLRGTSGVWSKVVKFLPLFSPILLPMTADTSSVTWWTLGIDFIVQFIEMVFFVCVASKMYRRGVVNYGEKPLFRWMLRKNSSCNRSNE